MTPRFTSSHKERSTSAFHSTLRRYLLSPRDESFSAPHTHKTKSDFIVKHSLTIRRRNRRIENSSEICKTFRLPFCRPPLPRMFRYVRFLFHFSCSKTTPNGRELRKKVTNELKGKTNLLIFSFDAVLSQHFNPFVTIFDSNKPFLCIAKGAEARYTSLIFLLRILLLSSDVDDSSLEIWKR